MFLFLKKVLKTGFQFIRSGRTNMWQQRDSFCSWIQFKCSATGQSQPSFLIRMPITNEVKDIIRKAYVFYKDKYMYADEEFCVERTGRWKLCA